MRTYGQYCAVAKALDVIGDRWTLLIVRELLLRGPSRYTDVRDGLPGVATNLLSDRLRALEDAGLVLREKAPPPIAATLFRLTARGEELRTVVDEVGRWGIPVMAHGPEEGDEFRSHWLAFPARLNLIDREPSRAPVTIEVRTGGGAFLIETAEGSVTTRPGSVDEPDAVLTGPPHPIAGLLAGRLALAAALASGVSCDGDPDAVRRVLPDVARRVSGAPVRSSGN